MNMSATTSQNAASIKSVGGQTTASQAETSKSLNPVEDFTTYVTTYARQNPGTAALWCFGTGFILGWKLKPW